MKKRTITLLIFVMALTVSLRANADTSFADGADFTGESFFRTSPTETSVPVTVKKNRKETMPPIKILRLNIQNKMDERAQKKMEESLAPTAPEEESHFSENKSTSSYVSKEVEEDFSDMTPDGFESDEESVEESNKKKFFSRKKSAQEDDIDKDTEDIILDCDNVDYDTPNYLIKANGNVNVQFVKQGTVVQCEHMTFDRISNTIKAEGNVKIVKGGNVVTGDYIFVDLNEENALIENPYTKSPSIEIRSKKGYVYGDKIVQEDGKIEVTKDYPIEFSPGRRGPQYRRMLLPKKDQFEEELQNGTIKLKADSIKIKQKGDLEVIAIRKGTISKGKRAIFKVPAVKIYTNKNREFVESNIWEVGYYRGLGLFTGPGWVFELPKASVLKVMPVLNYNEGFGVGAAARFSSATNQTFAAYGTASKKFFVLGEQKLDDNLSLRYGMNSFMDEWFLGRRRPKHGVGLVYHQMYGADGFVLPNRRSTFAHQLDVGYYHDLDFDRNFERIKSGGNIGTMRTRYMAQVNQDIVSYVDADKLKQFKIGVIGSMSAALYGTGDTQVVAMLGPRLTTQYKRWYQMIGYNFVAYDDNTPMKRYDAFRYGTQYLYLRETFRLCNWLGISWFTNINTTNDAINGRRIQENSFYLSFGPDDFKFHIGYDFERELLRANVEVMMDAKGANVEYKTFELSQDKKSKKVNRPVERQLENEAPTQPKVLQRAVVENVKVMEDVL